MPGPAITVVIATHERGEDCRKAVASVLAQNPPPLEVLICDDGSSAATEALLRRLATENGRVRYLRVDPSAGRPAPARNLGIDEARGEWIAFLDDDDRWLQGKLAAQTELIETDAYDVVASDAFRTSGDRYFGPRGGHFLPDRTMIMAANPVIASTAVARRSELLAVGGFETDRWLGGMEDYGLWLRLADRGARFVVIDEPLAIYEDAASSRLSAAQVRMQARLARLKWRRVRASPRDGAAIRSALIESIHIVRELASAVLRGVASRRSERTL
jgi:glycosyltransferase involved in cell wall biosynthesis